jgi:hypothetical protein
MLQLDFSIVSVALPTIQRSLHMVQAELQWIVTGASAKQSTRDLAGDNRSRSYRRNPRRRIADPVAGMASDLLGEPAADRNRHSARAPAARGRSANPAPSTARYSAIARRRCALDAD